MADMLDFIDWALAQNNTWVITYSQVGSGGKAPHVQGPGGAGGGRGGLVQQPTVPAGSPRVSGAQAWLSFLPLLVPCSTSSTSKTQTSR